MIGHTGFLLSTRRLAPGTVLPARRTRPGPRRLRRGLRRPRVQHGDLSGQ